MKRMNRPPARYIRWIIKSFAIYTLIRKKIQLARTHKWINSIKRNYIQTDWHCLTPRRREVTEGFTAIREKKEEGSHFFFVMFENMFHTFTVTPATPAPLALIRGLLDGWWWLPTWHEGGCEGRWTFVSLIFFNGSTKWTLKFYQIIKNYINHFSWSFERRDGLFAECMLGSHIAVFHLTHFRHLFTLPILIPTGILCTYSSSSTDTPCRLQHRRQYEPKNRNATLQQWIIRGTESNVHLPLS